MAANRPEIYKKDIASSLWRRYEKTDEFKKQGRIQSISSVHPLIKEAESYGLQKVIKAFIGKLQDVPNVKEAYLAREPHEWVEEWCAMHDLLFKTVYKSRGEVRPMHHNVTFGNPGDEELHRIPPGGGQTKNEILMLGRQISEELPYVNSQDIDSVCSFLARVHYGFIRVHPFHDGNGRVARALTDQLAISLGYPPIIAGFPRLIQEKKDEYHKAITNCVGDITCTSLKTWIQRQIDVKIMEIA